MSEAPTVKTVPPIRVPQLFLSTLYGKDLGYRRREFG